MHTGDIIISDLARKLGKLRKRQSFYSTIPGLVPLIDSFPAGIRTRTEATPFAQNPFRQKRDVSNEKNYSIYDVVRMTNGFSQASGELAEIFLWEPFFCGALELTNQKMFVEMYCALRGAGSWYTQMVIVPELRNLFDRGELVESLPFDAHFHPCRVFRALGKSADEEALHYLISAYLGVVPRGYPRSLFYDFQQFFGLPLSGMANELYRSLAKINFFDEFYPRFCRVTDIPSLFEEVVTATPNYEYCRTMLVQRLPSLDKLASRRRAQVRARRAIQRRAYQAFQVRYFGRNDLLIGAQDPRKVIGHVESYLDQLEAAAEELSNNGGLAGVSRRLTLADKRYQSKVVRPLRNRKVRAIRDKLGDKQLVIIATDFLDSLRAAPLDFRRTGDGLNDLLHRMDNVFSILESERRLSEGDRSALTKFVFHPLVANSHSLFLGEVSPAENALIEWLPK